MNRKNRRLPTLAAVMTTGAILMMAPASVAMAAPIPAPTHANVSASAVRLGGSHADTYPGQTFTVNLTAAIQTQSVAAVADIQVPSGFTIVGLQAEEMQTQSFSASNATVSFVPESSHYANVKLTLQAAQNVSPGVYDIPLVLHGETIDPEVGTPDYYTESDDASVTVAAPSAAAAIVPQALTGNQGGDETAEFTNVYVPEGSKVTLTLEDSSLFFVGSGASGWSESISPDGQTMTLTDTGNAGSHFNVDALVRSQTWAAPGQAPITVQLQAWNGQQYMTEAQAQGTFQVTP